jgi:hypothetical protein
MNDSEIQQTFLHPSDPDKSFMYPSLPGILWVPASKMLPKAVPETVMHHTYDISEKEFCCTTEKLKTRLHRV